MNTLPDALATLAKLDYDGLTDLIDLLKRDLDEKKRTPTRKGKPSLGDALASNPDLSSAYRACDDLDKTERETIIQQAGLLRSALAPQTHRKTDSDGHPVARGTVQSKIIHRPRLNIDTGEIVMKPYGPYLYIRVWATGGDRQRKKSRLKNIYLGKCGGGADRYHATEPGSDERRALESAILDAYYAGNLDELASGKLGNILKQPNKTDKPTTTKNDTVTHSTTDRDHFRPSSQQLTLLKKALDATADKPRYVSRDSASHERLIALANAGLVETFTRTSSKRIHYQLTDAGRIVANRKHHTL